ncbi:hypothetical protein [Companilactobacillus keshanensis]|uniref:Uncharacterized protein n=1 Tax=Companilactobacillus keshanensis TaxID=2486003 RepID=A0ABW4BWP3_9LACO|nr:hypothetical protein [Companilactobacillus keshanensis]
MSSILTTVSFIMALIVLGFLITWITGFFKKINTVSKVGKLGFIISISIFLAFSIGTGASLYKDIKEQSESEQLTEYMNNKALDSMKKFNKLYESQGLELETVGNKENRSWHDAIWKNSSTFDVDETLLTITMDNSVPIGSIKDRLKSLKSELEIITDNDTGDYDAQIYKDAYDKIEKMSKFIASPSGSYNNFMPKLTEMDDAVSDAHEKIKDIKS